jgi:hypothetical protein
MNQPQNSALSYGLMEVQLYITDFGMASGDIRSYWLTHLASEMTRTT